MKLRTRLNLVVAGLTATFVIVLIAGEILTARDSVREEIAAANRAASQLLGRLAAIYSREGGPELLLQFLQQLGRVHANDISLESASGEVLYQSPPPTYKAGRSAPDWFSRLLVPNAAKHIFPLPGGVKLIVQAHASRAVLDVWDKLATLLVAAAIMLVVVNALAFWSVSRALAPFPVLVNGLERIQRGDLKYRLPPLAGFEAQAMGSAFNRMAQAVQDKVQAERKALEAETQLEDRREMARLVEQHVEEERRLIAHELHDEFGQSVTAIRSLALAIAAQDSGRDPAMIDAARLIADEAARLYDAMHGLIPRLAPLSLDSLGLAASLDGLVRDSQRRYPLVEFSVRHDLAAELGPSVTLAAYRAVQEGLINAMRHAQAKHVDIDVRTDGHRMLVAITDDGIGLPEQWSLPGHFGLRGLRERITRLGGVLSVSNRESGGVCLNAEIPLTGSS
jgi:two-component system sensor histidine kinase UhpB